MRVCNQLSNTTHRQGRGSEAGCPGGLLLRHTGCTLVGGASLQQIQCTQTKDVSQILLRSYTLWCSTHKHIAHTHRPAAHRTTQSTKRHRYTHLLHPLQVILDLLQHRLSSLLLLTLPLERQFQTHHLLVCFVHFTRLHVLLRL